VSTTAEQQARDMLERAGVKDTQNFSSGDLVEIANLIARAEHLEQFACRVEDQDMRSLLALPVKQRENWAKQDFD